MGNWKEKITADHAILLAFVLVAAWIRLYGLQEWYWSPDDALHLSYGSANSAFSLLQTVLRHNTHSPGFFLLPYFMLKLSDSPLFLRSVSLIPGLLLILIFYYLGKEYKGRTAGIFMAFNAAFAEELVLVSEVIRQYSLLLCLIGLSLYLLFRYDKQKKTRFLWYYALLSFLAINIHYTAVIAIFTTAILWGIPLVKQRKHLFLWGMIHLLLAVFFLFLIFAKKATGVLEVDLAQASGEWLKTGFPGYDGRLWLANLTAILFGNALSFQPIPSFLLNGALFCGGIMLCFQHKEYRTLSLLGIPLLFNMFLTHYDLYPFSGGRWCIYTLPFVLLPMAYALETYVGYYRTVQYEKADIFTSLLFFCHIPRHRTTGLWLVMVFAVIVHAEESAFFRSHSVTNFPVRKIEYQTFMQHFLASTQEGDYVLTDRYLMNYIFYETRTRKDNIVSGDIHSFNYHGRILFYREGNSGIALRHIGEVQHLLNTLQQHVPGSTRKPLWFASVGWRAAIYKMATPVLIPSTWQDEEQNAFTNLAWKLLLSDAIKHVFINGVYGGGVMFSLPPDAVKSINPDFL